MKRLLFCLLGVCAFHLTVSAHVLDQYLQVTQIALTPDSVRIELRLIPGVQVADRICTLIDADANGQITKVEEQAYERRIWQDIGLEINGSRAPLTLTDLQFPTPQEMREGLGTIRLTYTAAATPGAAGKHQLYFHNHHLPEFGVYLVNALVPTTSEIRINGQERDPLQRGLRLDFYVTSAGTQPYWIGALLFSLCLALFIPQWKYVRLFLGQLDEKTPAKKTVA